MLKTPKNEKVRQARKLPIITINGCVAIDSDADQFLPLTKAEKRFGPLSYLGDWGTYSIYVRHGSAASVAKETAIITFNQTLIDLGLGKGAR